MKNINGVEEDPRLARLIERNSVERQQQRSASQEDLPRFRFFNQNDFAAYGNLIPLGAQPRIAIAVTDELDVEVVVQNSRLLVVATVDALDPNGRILFEFDFGCPGLARYVAWQIVRDEALDHVQLRLLFGEGRPIF